MTMAPKPVGSTPSIGIVPIKMDEKKLDGLILAVYGDKNKELDLSTLYAPDLADCLDRIAKITKKGQQEHIVFLQRVLGDQRIHPELEKAIPGCIEAATALLSALVA